MIRHGVAVPRVGAVLTKLAPFDLGGDGEIDTEDAELAERPSFFASKLYTGFVQRRAVARFKRAMEAREDAGLRSTLLDELAISRVIDEALRTQVDMARCLFSTAIGEKERAAFALSITGPHASRHLGRGSMSWAP